jgi:hypothetical protein
MKRLLLSLCLIVLAAPLAFAQEDGSDGTTWSLIPSITIPEDTLRRGTNGAKIADFHGVAVDARGNVWLQSHRPIENLTLTEDLQINNNTTTVKAGEQLGVTGLYCLTPEGNSCGDFSPLLTLKDDTGATVDTLGLFYRGVVDSTGNKKYESMTGRGLRASPDGETIYASFGSILYAIDASDGTKVGSRETFGGSLTSPGVDAAGNVYVAAVLSGSPGAVYSADLSREVETFDANVPAIGRAMDVSDDGLTVLVPRFTVNYTLMYTRPDAFSPFGAPDTVLIGLAPESIAFHPTNGRVYVGSGRPERVEANNTAFGNNYTPLVWYGFNVSDLSGDTPNPAPVDSLLWPSTQDTRGIEFSPDGMRAYGIGFDSELGLAVYTASTGTSVTLRDEVPTGTVVRNAPNPFSGSTTITFELTQAGAVTLSVYDLLGREVATLVDDVMPAATFDATFDASALPAGTYLYRLVTEGGTDTGTMTVLR